MEAFAPVIFSKRLIQELIRSPGRFPERPIQMSESSQLPDEDLREQALSKLRKSARSLKALTVMVNGEPGDAKAIEDADTELGLRLGKIGRADNGDGTFSYPLVLTLPAGKGRNGDAVTDAITRSSVEKLFEQITGGWTDTTPGGSTQHYIAVNASDNAEFETLVRSLAARVANYDGVDIARLDFAKYLPISPTATPEGSYNLSGGERGRLTLLTAAELHGVSVVLDELADTRDKLARGWYDIREHDQRTNAVRDRFNRQTLAVDAMRNLREAGWEQTSSTGEVADFQRGASIGQLVLGPRVFIVTDTPDATLASTAAVYRPFDVLAAFPQDAAQDTPEKLAAWLVDEGHVAAELDIFTARGERPQIEENQQYPVIVGAFADALRSARSRTDAEMPLVFSKTVEGEPDGIISVTPSGRVRRWDDKTATSLLLAAAQPAHVTQTKKGPSVSYRHSILSSIVQGVLMTVDSPGILPPVEYVRSEPMLTKNGKVAQHPGYDRGAKAVIAIPHRERARWAREYEVPDKPTLGQAQAAYDYLDLELLSDFAHETTVDRARHGAYLLTCVGRSLTNGSIAFLANARDRGTGKSLSLLIGRLLAQGHPSSVGFRVGGWADEETSKQLAGLLLAGGTFFHCDEVARGSKITGLTIMELVTAIDGEKAIRLLGGQDTIKQSGVILTLAGNAVELGGDANRRYFQINLAWSGGGSPISRTGFRHSNLVAFINQNRPKLLAAAHTILLYGLQNKPAWEVPGMGFTHDWAEKILGAMSHLTGSDGRDLATTALDGWEKEVAEADEIGEYWGELMAALWARHGDRPVTVAELRSTGTLPPAKGQPKPQLPPSLLGFSLDAEIVQNRKWAAELKTIRGTTIPHEGIFYRLEATDRKSKSKKSLTYFMSAYTAEGTKLISGRDLPEVGSKPVDTESTAEADMLDRPVVPGAIISTVPTPEPQVVYAQTTATSAVNDENPF